MPEHKRHHFVPRCHLKPFSREGMDRAICTYTIGKDILIPKASIKGQGARDYFHGRGKEIEEAFQIYEGGYASIVKQIINKSRNLTNSEITHLREFAF